MNIWRSRCTTRIVYVYVYIIVLCASFFGHTSSCSHIYTKRQRGWAQFDPWDHVAGGLGTILAVCRAWQAFFTFWRWAYLEQIPGLPWHLASCACYKGYTLSWYTLCAHTKPRGNVRSVFAVFLPSREHSHEHGQRAESTTKKYYRPAAPPAGNTVRVWHIHLRCTAVASWFFRGLALDLQSTTSLLLLLWSTSLFGTKILGPFKTFASTALIIIFPILSIFVCSPASASSNVSKAGYADNTDSATTAPSSTSSSRQYHARVAYPYVVHCGCGYVLHTAVQKYVQQQTDALVRARTSPGQASIAEKNKILNWNKRAEPSPTGTKAPTHIRTQPATQPPTHHPTTPSPQQTTQEACATAVQQWYIQHQTDALGSAPIPYLESLF